MSGYVGFSQSLPLNPEIAKRCAGRIFFAEIRRGTHGHCGQCNSAAHGHIVPHLRRFARQ